MTEQEAYLILRMKMALMDEGIGPKDPQPTDDEVVNIALGGAWDLLSEWERGEYFS